MGQGGGLTCGAQRPFACRAHVVVPAAALQHQLQPLGVAAPVPYAFVMGRDGGGEGAIGTGLADGVLVRCTWGMGGQV